MGTLSGGLPYRECLGSPNDYGEGIQDDDGSREKTQRKLRSQPLNSRKLEESLLRSFRTRENSKKARSEGPEFKTTTRKLASKPQNSAKLQEILFKISELDKSQRKCASTLQILRTLEQSLLRSLRNQEISKKASLSVTPSEHSEKHPKKLFETASRPPPTKSAHWWILYPRVHPSI